MVCLAGAPDAGLPTGNKVCNSAWMSIFDDLAAEEERLEKILLGLDEEQWLSPSGAAGWTIADVVLHLAQSEEGAAATATHGTLHGTLRGELGSGLGGELGSGLGSGLGVGSARWPGTRWTTGPTRPSGWSGQC